MKKLIVLFCVSILLLGSYGCKEKKGFISIYGTVSDYDTGKLIEGATVTVYPSGQWLTTKNDGYFEFNKIEFYMERGFTQEGMVTAIGGGEYISKTVEFALIPNDRKEINIKMKKYSSK